MFAVIKTGGRKQYRVTEGETFMLKSLKALSVPALR